MRFSANKEVFKMFPKMFWKVVLLYGFDNKKFGEEILKLLRKQEEVLRKSMLLEKMLRDKRAGGIFKSFW